MSRHSYNMPVKRPTTESSGTPSKKGMQCTVSLHESGGDQSHHIWAKQSLCHREIWLQKSANKQHYPEVRDHH